MCPTRVVVVSTRAADSTRVVVTPVSSARLRRKLARVHVVESDDELWPRQEFTGKGAPKRARRERLWSKHFGVRFEGWLEQPPVKYNRCRLCGYRRHCAPDLVDQKIRLGVKGRTV